MPSRFSTLLLGSALLFSACTGEPQAPTSFVKMDASTDRDGGDNNLRDGGPDDNRDAGPRDAGPVRDGGMAVTPTTQIIAVRLSPPGPQAPSRPVAGVFVTYVRAALGTDPAGFFVQFETNGPALFVAVDPTTLTPAPVVGDEVAFAVADTEVVDAQHRVLSISSWTVRSSGNDITALVQDLSMRGDLVTSLSSYESEVITINGMVAGPSSPAGAGHRRAAFSTMGLPSEPQLVLRAEESLFDSLGLVEGCNVVVGPIAMWRFQTTAQVLVLRASEIVVNGCSDGPGLVSARAVNDTTVELTFNRPLDPATVQANRFVVTPTVAITAAATNSNIVTLTTGMLGELTPYSVSVAAAVTDTFGTPVDATMNSANFSGPSNAVTPAAAGDIIFTEIMQNPNARADGDGEYVEVYNPTATAFDLAGCRLHDTVADDHSIGTPVVVLPGGYATLARGPMPGFVPDYVFSNVTLANGGDRVVLTCGTTEIDRVEWDGGPTFPDPTGASMNLDPMSFDSVSNDVGSNWCTATSVFNTDRGSPGAPNDACMGTPTDGGVVDAGNRDGGPVRDGGPGRDAGPRDGGPPPAGSLVINEVDYDSVGTDNFEFVELYNGGAAAADLTNLAVVMVNGSNDTEYRRVDLTGTLASGAYLLIANVAVVGPTGVPIFIIPSNGVQNGAPDGVVLINAMTMTVLDAISYEGSITAGQINGFPTTTNLVEGTPTTASDNSSTTASIVRLPNGSDTNDAATDWVTTSTPTPGLANVP